MNSILINPLRVYFFNTVNKRYHYSYWFVGVFLYDFDNGIQIWLLLGWDNSSRLLCHFIRAFPCLLETCCDLMNEPVGTPCKTHNRFTSDKVRQVICWFCCSNYFSIWKNTRKTNKASIGDGIFGFCPGPLTICTGPASKEKETFIER